MMMRRPRKIVSAEIWNTPGYKKGLLERGENPAAKKVDDDDIKLHARQKISPPSF